MCAVARLQHRVYALEVAGEIDRVRPRAVVVAEDERLASVEPLQQPLRVIGAEEEVAHHEHVVVLPDLAVPPPDECLVHLLQRSERPPAQAYDVPVPQMQI